MLERLPLPAVAKGHPIRPLPLERVPTVKWATGTDLFIEWTEQTSSLLAFPK